MNKKHRPHNNFKFILKSETGNRKPETGNRKPETFKNYLKTKRGGKNCNEKENKKKNNY